MSYRLNSYQLLRANKAKINAAFDAAGTPQHLRRLFLGMAFLETTTLSCADRDASKDGWGEAANVTCWNLSLHMCKMLGCSNPWSLNNDLVATVRLLKQGVDTWGRDRLLCFVRGGYTAFKDGCSYGAKDYIATIATLERAISDHPELMWNDQRPDVYLNHV